jgi:hypothetical protein
MFYKELAGRALDAYNKMNDKLVAQAEMQLGLSFSAGELVLRPLLPTDIGLTTTQNWKYAPSATAYNTLVNATIEDTRFVGINGIAYAPTVTASSGLAEQSVSGVKITRASKTAREWNIQELPGEGNDLDPTKRSYVDDPITVDQNITLKIEAYGLTASSSAYLSFIGSVVEPAGKVIAV